MVDAMTMMDHTWFQVIESRSGPDHTCSACAQKTQVPQASKTRKQEGNINSHRKNT
ncbi:hypothetical protein DPMN_190198 [Dreissena polymorpha]|uniref:Uncharacterized protein n=1 Tax=Dreissena polymorpha TaxID=45954 RepID=A0A9D4ICW8_DREPO|nr:hypothetical protein DPMN_190198 [Dreissena polymorpha]